MMKGAAGLLVPMFVPSRLLAGESAPSNRLNVGSIGVGGMGRGHLRELVRRADVQVLAVCDVNKNNLDRAIETVSEAYGSRDCASYTDFRQLLGRGDIDAVFIATPDHWHALCVIAAVRAGKDVYGEKPLSLTVEQGRAMADAVKSTGRVFQAGSQQRSSFFFRHGCELIRNGHIGQVKSIIVGIGGPAGDCVLAPEPTPDYVDWNMWLGPAPWQPYNYGILRRWRRYWDYSGGEMTDWGAHHFDIAQWAMGMDRSGPVEVHPPKGDKEVTFVYSNGVTLTRRNYKSWNEQSILVTGTDGTVEMHREWIHTQPRSLAYYRIKPDEIRLYENNDHKQNFFDCIRSRRACVADIETAHRSVTVCHIGNIAYRLNRSLKWDPAKECFIGDDGANRMLSRAMRSPWRL
jgi:predicted dehydrogenase